MKKLMCFLPSIIAGLGIGAALQSDYTAGIIFLASAIAFTNARITVLDGEA